MNGVQLTTASICSVSPRQRRLKYLNYDLCLYLGRENERDVERRSEKKKRDVVIRS